MCQCNRPRSKHSLKAQRAYASEQRVWRNQIHTEALPTDAYGEIEFVGYGQRLGKVPYNLCFTSTPLGDHPCCADTLLDSHLSSTNTIGQPFPLYEHSVGQPSPLLEHSVSTLLGGHLNSVSTVWHPLLLCEHYWDATATLPTFF